MPSELLRRLGQLYYGQATRNARLGASFEEVLAAFSRSGVPAIVLKGVSIAELVYGNIALRPLGDLDVLVQRRDLDLAERIVLALGYVPDESSHPAEWYRHHHHHLVECYTPDRTCKVDVHHHIFPPAAGLQVPIEDFWQRARPMGLGSARTMVLAPTDLLLHLCVSLSAVEHFVGGLRTLCDVAAAIKRYQMELDWAGLFESARMYHLEKQLYYPLWLAWSLVGADVPAHVLDQLGHFTRGHGVEAAATKGLIRSAIFRPGGDRSVPAVLVRRVLAELLAAKGGKAKVGGLLGVGYLGFRRSPGRLGRSLLTSLRRASRILS